MLYDRKKMIRDNECRVELYFDLKLKLAIYSNQKFFKFLGCMPEPSSNHPKLTCLGYASQIKLSSLKYYYFLDSIED